MGGPLPEVRISSDEDPYGTRYISGDGKVNQSHLSLQEQRTQSRVSKKLSRIKFGPQPCDATRAL